MSVKRYSISMVIDTPWDPNEWDWSALLVNTTGEHIVSVFVEEIEQLKKEA